MFYIILIILKINLLIFQGKKIKNHSRKTFSFCTSSCDRLWQIKNTLLKNLENIDDDCEIVLVDYMSKDGLSEWVEVNCSQYLNNGRLIFFKVTNKVTWNVSRAKNLAHRLSEGSTLINIDADNFVTRRDIDLFRESIKYSLPFHQWSGSWTDGSYGRIGLPRDLFFSLGGYDESMLPMGGQDVDILSRINAMGIKPIRLFSPTIKAITNSIKDKVAQINSRSNEARDLYNKMNYLNLTRGKIRLEIEGPCIQGGFASFEGLLNGKKIMIDGLNEIEKL